MQTSTVSPAINLTTTANTTTVTKSREQILIQSSGAMIAVIVLGIIIILTILLIILKTYNRRTHASRVLGASAKPRPKQMSQSTSQTNVPMSPMRVSSVSGSVSFSNPPSENGFKFPRAELSSVEDSSNPPSENGFRLPRAELSSVDENIEQISATSGSTTVTIHDLPVMEDT